MRRPLVSTAQTTLLSADDLGVRKKFGYGKEKPKICDCATHGGVSLRVDTKKGLQNGVRLDDPIAC
jgi:hypothetical protein